MKSICDENEHIPQVIVNLTCRWGVPAQDSPLADNVISNYSMTLLGNANKRKQMDLLNCQSPRPQTRPLQTPPSSSTVWSLTYWITIDLFNVQRTAEPIYLMGIYLMGIYLMGIYLMGYFILDVAAQTATVGRVLISKMFTNLNKRNKRKKRNKRRLLLLYQMDDIIFPYLLDSPFNFTFAGVRRAST